MKDTAFGRDTITLRGKEIEVKVGFIPHLELRFYPENPRVYSIVSADHREPSQDEIEKALKRMDHVKLLVQSIKANGGLTDPLLVRDGDLVVLEGNSRLAAYRTLFARDPSQWGEVKCKLLPKDIPDEHVFALLGEYHIIGKKDWAPYEQAGYLYRRHKRHGVSSATMANEVGLSARRVGQLIDVYEFMLEHDDNDVQRWSYYEEYLKHNPIKRAREEYPNLDEVVVEKIKSHEILRAVDVRDKLIIIAKSVRACKDFASGRKDFERAFESAQAHGAGNCFYDKLKRFRAWFDEDDRVEDIDDMSPAIQKKCAFELTKVRRRCDRLLKGLGQ